jgi:cytochrome c oxidase subunit IV
MTTDTRGTPSRALFLTLLALLLLAGASLAFRFAHLGAFGYAVALAIAAAKAALVVMFFMEIGDEKASVKFAFVSGLALVALLMSLTLADVVTRAPPPLTAPPGMAQRDLG